METTESLDVSVEEEAVVKGGFQQPMDLGSPLDSDPEFELSGDLLVPGEQQEGVELEPDLDEEDQQQQQLLDGEGEKEREETTEQEEKDGEGEEAMEDKTEEGEGAGERRVERLDSNFDSSYQPGAEELLYEGDPDNETETKPETEEEVEGTPTKDDATPDTVSHEQQQPQQQDSQRGREKEATGERREEEEGFMVEVHYKDQGSLEDPVAVNPGLQEASGKKEASKASGDGSKTTSDSSRFVLLCVALPPFLSPQGYSNWSPPHHFFQVFFRGSCLVGIVMLPCHHHGDQYTISVQASVHVHVGHMCMCL